MATVMDTIQYALRYITTLHFTDFLDIALIAYLIYKVLSLMRKTNTLRVLKGLALLLVVLGGARIFQLNMINFLLRRALELGLIALVILFQPELRRLLERIGSSKLSVAFGSDFKSLNVENAITQTVLACADMSEMKRGALIVFVRDNQLKEPIRTGTIINADVTAELLKNLFFVKAPLHDGAVIISNGRIVSAGCILPISSNLNLSKDLGMRHRAGIGISERSDAVVVIVSEETGAISVAVDGMLKRHLSAETVEVLLRKELVPEITPKKKKIAIFDLFKVNKHE